MKLVIDGALKVEAKIYDSEANEWKIAADVIPQLDLAPTLRSSKVWQAPPRPTELRDFHIVDLNRQSTGNIDYFALIAERNRNARPRTLTDATSGKVRADGTSDTAQSSLKKDGITVLETERTGDIITLFTNPKAFVAKHSTSLAVAASVSVVFIGTYHAMRSISESRSRVPANAPVAATPAKAISTAPVMAPQAGASLTADGTLGNGRNKVQKANSATPDRPNAPPPTVYQAPAPAEAEPPREPPQFYSSREGLQQGDPNSGTVSPPGFVPPPGFNANESPMGPPRVMYPGATLPGMAPGGVAPGFQPAENYDPNTDPSRFPSGAPPQTTN
jgi:hypothetical protein